MFALKSAGRRWTGSAPCGNAGHCCEVPPLAAPPSGNTNAAARTPTVAAPTLIWTDLLAMLALPFVSASFGRRVVAERDEMPVKDVYWGQNFVPTRDALLHE